MKNKMTRITVLFLLLAFISLACCSFFGGDKDTTVLVAPDEQEELEMVDDEVPAAQQEEVVVDETGEEDDSDGGFFGLGSDVELGEEYRSEEGGFSFSVIPDYEVFEMFGMVNMAAPDADEENGPYILMVGGSSDDMELEADSAEEMNIDDIVGEFGAAGGESELLEQKEITVGGYPAETMLYRVKDETGEEVYGRVVMTEVSNTQGFVLMATAPTARWEDELEPLAEALIGSIEFFEPTPIEFDLEEFQEELEGEFD